MAGALVCLPGAMPLSLYHAQIKLIMPGALFNNYRRKLFLCGGHVDIYPCYFSHVKNNPGGHKGYGQRLVCM
jgi:hypothetical protein